LESADCVAGLGHSCLFDRAGDPEIDQIGEVVAVQQDVGGLDVAMQQADLMGGV
jgi:hypothetical protein